MNREIKFRGRRYDNGEWIYGSLVDWGNHEQLVIFPPLETASSLPLETIIAMKAKSVDYKTIGQYTGVKDSKGTEIYEGDIIEGTIVSQWNKEVIYCVVEYIKDGFFSVEYFSNNSYTPHKLLFGKDCKVVGNIYDDIELLKERF